MCGIAGILSSNTTPQEREAVEVMTNALSHRGPDAFGVETLGGLCLGHRRLSIIDMDGGRQPMQSGDGRLLLSFNGEIFNYLELKQELESRGEWFQTSSDTEVLLSAFACYGVEAFPRLNGQFAAAFYDASERTVTLTRDLLGEKPLYYFEHSGFLIFASEMQALLCGLRKLGVSIELNNQAFFDYHSLNYVPGVNTFVEGVYSLPPGSYLRFQAGGPSRISFWKLAKGEEVLKKEAGVCLFERLLENSLRFRLRSDVPVGVFASGGVDSTAILVGLAEQAAEVTAYIADFRESSFSEAPAAEAVCKKLGIPYSVFPIDVSKENLPALIETLSLHEEEPLADSSSLPVYLLSREARKHVKVVLSGDGGDELFGGYLTYRATSLSGAIPQFLREGLGRLHPLCSFFSVSDRKVGIGEKLDRFLRNLSLPPGAAHFAWNGMFGLNGKKKLLHEKVLSELSLEDTFVSLARLHGVSLESPKLQELLLADQGLYLPNDILAKVDRMSMAHGLEVRPVLLDPGIVQFARDLPESAQVRFFQGKQILRGYLREKAPWYSLRQRKQGFSIPVHLWMRTILRDYVGDLLHSDFARSSELYNHSYILALWESHQRRDANVGFELWGILMSLLWCRKYLSP